MTWSRLSSPSCSHVVQSCCYHDLFFTPAGTADCHDWSDDSASANYVGCFSIANLLFQLLLRFILNARVSLPIIIVLVGFIMPIMVRTMIRVMCMSRPVLIIIVAMLVTIVFVSASSPRLVLCVCEHVCRSGVMMLIVRHIMLQMIIPRHGCYYDRVCNCGCSSCP